MADPDALTAFYLALEDDPGDQVTLLALADWYEEHDQLAAADALRWTVQHGRRPYCYPADGGLTVSSPEWHLGWFWWAVEDAVHTRDWGHPPHCRLPRTVWEKLRHSFRHRPAVFKEYPRVRDAYEALIDAWPRVGPIEFSPPPPSALEIPF
jgi:hypothetical protein